MSEEKKTKRGGKREGAGRPSAGDPLEKITILVRADQKEAIDQRGNRSEQIREAIDLYLGQQAAP